MFQCPAYEHVGTSSQRVILGRSPPRFGQAKNVLLFVGDGAGVSSLNAASIYGYGKPQSLYVQKMPHLAIADTYDRQ
jgi:alkaline phosphatase